MFCLVMLEICSGEWFRQLGKQEPFTAIVYCLA